MSESWVLLSFYHGNFSGVYEKFHFVTRFTRQNSGSVGILSSVIDEYAGAKVYGSYPSCSGIDECVRWKGDSWFLIEVILSIRDIFGKRCGIMRHRKPYGSRWVNGCWVYSLKMMVSLSEWRDKKYQGNKFRYEEIDDSEVNDGLRNVWHGWKSYLKLYEALLKQAVCIEDLIAVNKSAVYRILEMCLQVLGSLRLLYWGRCVGK